MSDMQKNVTPGRRKGCPNYPPEFKQQLVGGCGRFPGLSGDKTCLLKKKIRAIELYFKYGKKLAPVVRELGYPSKRNLRRWIRSWEAGGGAKESIRHKHRYSDEQKQVAVEHYLNHGCCLAFTSRALGYPCTDVLARWVNELYPDRRRIFTSKANPVAPFEPEVKRQAVMALCTRQVSASEIARRIGVSRAVLYK